MQEQHIFKRLAIFMLLVNVVIMTIFLSSKLINMAYAQTKNVKIGRYQACSVIQEYNSTDLIILDTSLGIYWTIAIIGYNDKPLIGGPWKVGTQKDW